MAIPRSWLFYNKYFNKDIFESALLAQTFQMNPPLQKIVFDQC